MSQPRQTTTYLMKRFDEVGIGPLARYGQNFLIDLNLLSILVDAAELGPQDVVLEVGTGTGSLTAMLAEQAGAVVTVEIDRRLFQLASEQLGDNPKVVMLEQDALKSKNRLHPTILQTVRERMDQIPGARFKLVANLPFNVATPIIANLLDAEFVPDLMVITIQRELAERILAYPSTKDYGALSVWIQSQCDAEILRILPPSVFWPRPQVDSAFVKIVLNPEKRARIGDISFFHNFARSMFFHRRKFLRSELLSMLKGQVEKPEIDELMREFDLPADARAEQLTVEGMLLLCEAIRSRGWRVEL